MKNLFSFNVKAEEQPYNSYIIKKADSAVLEEQDDTFKKANEFQKKYSLPLYLRIIMGISFFAFAIIFCGVFNAITKGTSFSKAYDNAPYLFYICGACFLICIIIFGIAYYLFKKGKKDPQYSIIEQEIQTTIAHSFENLGVPADALDISIIAYYFKHNKKGKERAVTYTSCEMKLYADSDNLYIADTGMVTAIPFTDIQKIVENKKRTQIPQWTKDESYRSLKYKSYKIKINNGHIAVKTYSMRINANGTELEVLIPNYELETFKTFLDVPVIDLKPNKKTQP